MSVHNEEIIEFKESELHGYAEWDAFEAFVELLCGDYAEAMERFRDAYCGQYASIEDYAETSTDDMGGIVIQTANGPQDVTMSELCEALNNIGYHAPDVDVIAWNCDHTITDSGFVFRAY